MRGDYRKCPGKRLYVSGFLLFLLIFHGGKILKQPQLSKKVEVVMECFKISPGYSHSMVAGGLDEMS